jgi:DNA processing protein
LAPARDAPAQPPPAHEPPPPLDAAERLACLRLIRSDNVGPVTFRELVRHFGSAGKALDALPELSRRGGRRQPLHVCTRAAAEAELEAAVRIGARLLFVIEPAYPSALAAIDAAPPVLYAKGNTGHLTRPMIAIVGARNGSAAGQKLTRLFASHLGHAGFVIASGLARGIDAAAHEAGLETGTVAALAGGIDNVYPPENARLQQEIGERGCLVSENPPGFAPRAQDFPRRNRIISGLSMGVVIMEAARRSGTLITARLAGEQGREVFAVPGHPLDPRAEGTNALIKSGAILVTQPEEVASALAPMLRDQAHTRFADPPPPAPLPPRHSPRETAATSDRLPLSDADRERLLAALGPAPVDMDELARTTGLPPRVVQATLLELALAGRLTRHGHQLVSLKG